MSRPEWYYDDLRQVGTDFTDAEQVAAYDRNQARDPAADRDLVASLRLDPGQTLLDLGCGTGQFACEAARLAREVIAVDVSPAMLAFARDRASKEKLANLRFVHAGFLSYEHGGPPVDVVVSKSAFHHLPDFWKAVALRRMHGWLKPGGLCDPCARRAQHVPLDSRRPHRTRRFPHHRLQERGRGLCRVPLPRL